MRVEEHYARLLQQPPPWKVVEEERVPEQRVTVFLRWPDGVRPPCPECGERMPVYDRMPERT